MATNNITKKETVKKALNWAASIISIIIAIFALILIISSLTSGKRGYTAIFGKAYYTVASESMNTGKEDGFAKGDIIYVDLLKDSEKGSLKKGDVITFWDTIGGRKALNTHRIEEVIPQSDGSVEYRTKGDANEYKDTTLRTEDDVQGIYIGKSEGFGKAIIWMQSKTGFLVCVIVPSILIVLYCLYLVIINIIQYNKKKLALAKEEYKEEIDEEMRRKLKEELRKELEAESGSEKKDEE